MPSTSRPPLDLPVRPAVHAPGPRRRLRSVAGAVLLPLVLVSAACGTGGDEGGDGAGSVAAGAMSAPGATQAASAEGAVTAAAAGTAAGDALGDPSDGAPRGAAGAGLARLSVGQRIAQTADLTLRIRKDRLDETLDAVARDAERLGGYVVSSTSGDAGDRAAAEGSIVVRVPVGRFLTALRSIGARGTVLTRTVGSEDVTQSYVDTQARLRHDRAVEGRLLTLLGRAEKVGEVLAVQDRLSTVQEEIEISKGRIEQLAGMTELSTIAVHLREPGVVTRPAGTIGGWGVRAALRDAAHNAVAVVNGAIVVLGALLPLVLVGAVLAPLGLRLRRRRDGGPRGTRGPAPDVT